MQPFLKRRARPLRISITRTFVATLILVLCINGSLYAESTPAADYSEASDPLLPLLDPILTRASQDFHGADLTGKDGPLEKIGFDLSILNAEYIAHLATTDDPATFQAEGSLFTLTHIDSETYVVVDVIANADVSVLAAALDVLGFQNGETFGAVVSGEMPIAALPSLAALPNLRFARPAPVVADAGISVSQAERVLGTDNASGQLGLDGTGIRVGVLSDSYDCLGGAAIDVASGDVPADVEVLAEESRCATGKDEGRAMVQLIADIVPGATQFFHTALGGQAHFANGILELANVAHADVIVDDVRYLTEPMFQDGIVAQAVDQVVAAGVPYFSSAGNNARQAYESPFVPTLGLLPLNLLHDFDPTSKVDTKQRIMIPVGATATFDLQWDQPYASAMGGAGAESDLDMRLLKPSSLSPVAVAIDNNLGRDPIEILRYTNPGPDTSFDLEIMLTSGPEPTLMKYIYTGSGLKIEEYDTKSGTIYGHANAHGARAVGAAFYLFTPAFGTLPPIVELFSSSGSTPILFDHNNAPIYEVRRKPEFVAPDGVNTTFFGTDIGDPGDGSDSDTFPNFFGTSAAAPNAAAVAVLLLAANPALSPNQIYAALDSSTMDMGVAGFDDDTGYGLLQAIPALEGIMAHDLLNTQKGMPAIALPGQLIEYSVTLTNLGPNSTHGVYLENRAPANLLDLVAASSTGFITNTSTSTLKGAEATAPTWRVSNLVDGESLVVTFSGLVDPDLSVDQNFVNETVLSSFGDNQLANNYSQANVLVKVPRVQFDSSVVEGDSSKIFRIVIDRINPYADVTVRYTTSSTLSGAGYVPFSGIATIRRGEPSVTVNVPNYDDAAIGETITLHLGLAQGSMLGSLTTVVITTNPDSDEDDVADDDDPTPQDPCDPDLQADPCDQEPDGLTNAEEMFHNTDPTKPDTDGDSLSDGDEVKNGSDPLDICDPNPDAEVCDDTGNDGGAGDVDHDGDGTNDGSDIDPLNPCIPNQNSPACQQPDSPNVPKEFLYLPGIRGKTE